MTELDKQFQALRVQFSACALGDSISKFKDNNRRNIDFEIPANGLSNRLRTVTGAPFISAILAFVSSR